MIHDYKHYETTPGTSREDVKNTLQTSGEDVKNTLQTSGEDVKNTLQTSGKDVVRKVWIDCTSGDFYKTVEIFEKLKNSLNIDMIDCAVSGGPMVCIFYTRLECSFMSSPLVSSVVMNLPHPFRV